MLGEPKLFFIKYIKFFIFFILLFSCVSSLDKIGRLIGLQDRRIEKDNDMVKAEFHYVTIDRTPTFNKLIQRTIDNRYENFYSSLKENFYNILNDNRSFQYIQTYQVYYNPDFKLISLLLIHQWVEQDNDTIHISLDSFIYSTLRNKIIDIKDIFNQPTEIYKKISSYTKGELIKNINNSGFIERIIKGDKDHLKYLLVDKDGMYTVFPNTLFAESYEGTTNIFIPWEYIDNTNNLKNIFSKYIYKR